MHSYPTNPQLAALGDGYLRPGRSGAAADLLFSAARMARGTMFCSIGPRPARLSGFLWALPGSAATAIRASRRTQSP
jgi:hypothetical protein